MAGYVAENRGKIHRHCFEEGIGHPFAKRSGGEEIGSVDPGTDVGDVSGEVDETIEVVGTYGGAKSLLAFSFADDGHADGNVLSVEARGGFDESVLFLDRL